MASIKFDYLGKIWYNVNIIRKVAFEIFECDKNQNMLCKEEQHVTGVCNVHADWNLFNFDDFFVFEQFHVKDKKEVTIFYGTICYDTCNCR